jgi:hypothetical protein
MTFIHGTEDGPSFLSILAGDWSDGCSIID